MTGRKRTLLLTVLALAVPLPAYAITDRALEAVGAGTGPATIEVSTTLASCGVLEDGVVCKLEVSFGPVPEAASYAAAVTRADGSVIDYGAIEPGGAALWVPYVGSGVYSVRITAYGAPERGDDRNGRGEVVATGNSRTGEEDDSDREPREVQQLSPETEVEGREPGAGSNPDSDGEATSEVGSSAAATEPACTPATTEPAPVPTPPVEPPQDLDPANPDEDADAIPDEQERVTYEQQLAEYEAALATQAEAPAPAPAC